MRADSSDFPVALIEMTPGFELRKAVAGKVPEGITYAGIVRTPDGETYGIHARVEELDDGHKRFVGGLFRVEP